MNNVLYEFLLKLPRKNLINLMWESLDLMQHWNGRSRTYCITLAMGYEFDKDENILKSPTFREVKANTNSIGL